MMFIAYTITYIILLYFGPTVEIISPLFMIVLSLLREFYLVFVFFYFVYSVSVRNRIIFSAENVLFVLLPDEFDFDETECTRYFEDKFYESVAERIFAK